MSITGPLGVATQHCVKNKPLTKHRKPILSLWLKRGGRNLLPVVSPTRHENIRESVNYFGIGKQKTLINLVDTSALRGKYYLSSPAEKWKTANMLY